MTNSVPNHTVSQTYDTLLHAQPYDISASGFYFATLEEYQRKATTNRNDYGDEVEEYEIQFIDGDDIDCELFKALSVNQSNFQHFFEAIDAWEEHEKQAVIIAVGECSYDFDIADNDLSVTENVDIYLIDSMNDLAEQFVEEGLFGEIPENIRCYLDMDAIARDLNIDYTETSVAGTNIVYRAN